MSLAGLQIALLTNPLLVAGAQAPGSIFYVDGNRVASGSGKTWQGAFKTLSEALAASHADIALTAKRNWAGRNTIFVKADSITEDLVLFADKTDVIGVGAKDAYSMPCIVGNHVPTAGMSCRFFNVQFRGAIASGGIIVTLGAGVPGTQFHGCHFNGWSTTPATIGLKSTASPGLEVHGCKFLGRFSTAAVHLLTGNGNGTMIKGNIIESAGIGIDLDSGFTCANEAAFILDNKIYSAGLPIDDDATTVAIMGNTCVCTGVNAAGQDITATQAAGNIVTASDKTMTFPVIATS